MRQWASYSARARATNAFVLLSERLIYPSIHAAGVAATLSAFLCWHLTRYRANMAPIAGFPYDGDIPVYATSAINDGLVDTRNRDLNGVRFVETPTMLPPQNSDRLGRLRALGSDALTLAQRWQQLHQTEQWVIRGQTGLLRRRENGSIERALELSTFDGAEVKRWDVE